MKQGEALYHLDSPDALVELLLYGGGAGGGKTWFGCVWQIMRRLKYPGTVGFMGRNTLTDLRDTTMETFWRVAKENFGLLSDLHYRYNKNEKRITFCNGSKIFLRELKYNPADPDFDDLGSLELTDAFVDEVTELTEKAVNILRSRIRYNLVNGRPALLLAGNPANNWVRWRFVHEEKGPRKGMAKALGVKERFVRALVYDNPDKKFVETYVGILEDLPDYDKGRLLHGDWGVKERVHPFFQAFDEARHVSRYALKIDVLEPLWLSMDFNIDPTTLMVSQKLEGLGCRTYDVIQRVGTQATCEAFGEVYGSHPAGFLLTGDHSGHSGSSAMGTLPGGQYHTDFEVVKEVLDLTDYDLVDTRTVNPRQEYSRKLCHHFLTKIPYRIDGTNTANEALIGDLNTARVLNGKLYKDRARGHPQDVGDAFRYQVHAWFQGDFSRIRDFADEVAQGAG